MRTQRIFIALDPPAAVRGEVAAWSREIGGATKGLRPVPPRNSHMTLAFLGERSAEEIRLATEVLGECAAPVSGLDLGAPIWLPRRRPRSLALEVHDRAEELSSAQASIAAGLGRAIDWRPERAFRPHLTAARTSRGFERENLRFPVSPALSFDADSITLYASRLLPEGAEYEPLARVSV